MVGCNATSSVTVSYFTVTFDCLAASNWPSCHPHSHSDYHVSNYHHPQTIIESRPAGKIHGYFGYFGLFGCI